MGGLPAGCLAARAILCRRWCWLLVVVVGSDFRRVFFFFCIYMPMYISSYIDVDAVYTDAQTSG